MAGHSLPTPFSQARKQSHTDHHTPSMRTVLIIFVALLILFGWLHLILALEIASTGRQIQIKTEELKEIQRDNNNLRWKIAKIWSSAEMARRAIEEGYEPRQPIYLPPPQSSSQP